MLREKEDLEETSRHELSFMNQEGLLYQRESYGCFVSLDSFFFFF